MRRSRGKTFSTTWRKARIPLLILLSCSLLGVGLYGMYHPGFQKLKRIREETKLREDHIKRLQQENDELAERIRTLRNPTDNLLYVEKVARQKIGLVRDGEVVYDLKRFNQ